MIQMVGPNDNDYIYINFKDFEYDKKWEFPRENLELGMNQIKLYNSISWKSGKEFLHLWCYFIAKYSRLGTTLPCFVIYVIGSAA